ncbi:hypothetical protein BS78_09G004400 [Paspalum vaginatum]|nr:hypothetical protein BS78_09G004400 [Paspalum vaginatum]
MSLRALGSLLTRFSQRGGPRGLASRSSSRSLHTLRDLDIGDGAFGALAVGSFAALFLSSSSSSKEEDEPLAPPQVTNNMYRDPAIRAKFTDQDGKVDWVRCLDYIKLRKRLPEMSDEEALATVAADQARHRRLRAKLEALDVQEEDTKQMDESAVMARFEEWMKEHGRSYESEEEKADRYKNFKVNAMRADRAKALFPSGPRFAPNNLGDWSREEISRLYMHRDDADWESHFENLARRHDKMRADNHLGNFDLSDCTDAVKECYKKQAAMAAERGATAGGRRMGDDGARPRVNSTERVSQIRTQARGVRG